MSEILCYVVRGRDDMGSIVFYNVDSNTSYPSYYSSHDYTVTDDLIEAMGWLSEANNSMSRMSEAEVCQIKFEPIDIKTYQQDMKHADNVWQNNLNENQRAYIKNKLGIK